MVYLYSSDVSGIVHAAPILSVSAVIKKPSPTARYPSYSHKEVYSISKNSWNEVGIENTYKKNEGLLCPYLRYFQSPKRIKQLGG